MSTGLLPGAPDPDVAGAARRRGTLTMYLGAVAGVGKTRAMLAEGRRRQARGARVVVAYAETHGRPGTLDELAGLEVVPRRVADVDGRRFEEMDLDAVLARRPTVALVDEYAHTNVPTSRHEHRWEDVQELLEAGVDVISTLNVQHLESLNDVVERITGVRPRGTVPDAIVRQADAIELIDMTPEALRRRIAEDEAPERADQALSSYFQLGNLTALRKLALQWVTERADERLERYREDEGITEPWETQERVVVALTEHTEAERLIRRGARIAARVSGELIVATVRPEDGLVGGRTTLASRQRALTESMGGRYVELHGADAVDTLVTFARLRNASQLVLGMSQRPRRAAWTQRATVRRIQRMAGPIDIHLVATDGETARHTVRRRAWAALPHRRQIAGWCLALIATPALALALIPLRGTQLGLSTAVLVLLLEVAAVGLVGGLLPALSAAVIACGMADWYYTIPYHSLRVAHLEDILILAVFLTMAVVASALAARLARRGHEARRAQAEAQAFAQLATTSVLPDSTTLAEILEPLASAFQLDAVAILSPSDDTASPWRIEGVEGNEPELDPVHAAFSAELADGALLVADAPSLTDPDRQVLEAFAAQLRRAQERIQLQADAASASVLAERTRVRAAILNSVSHDLRTPLTSIKAAATSLLSPDVDWPAAAVRSFCEHIDEEADRLNRVVANLLDLSRLQGGSLDAKTEPTHVDGVINGALATLHPEDGHVVVELAGPGPVVEANPALFERVLVNVLENALQWSPAPGSVRVSASRRGDHIAVSISDQGPGIPPDRRSQVFQPFQRLHDHRAPDSTGIGLGLAVARGLTEAMGGHLRVDDRSAPGTTIIVELNQAVEGP